MITGALFLAACYFATVGGVVDARHEVDEWRSVIQSRRAER